MAFSASSQAAARISITLLVGSSAGTVFSDMDASLSSSSLLAQAAMFILPSCVPKAIISLLVFICSSFSDNSLFALGGFVREEVSAALPGDDGLEELGLRIGVVALTGVPFLEGSWLAMGVISVPMSLIDTDLAVEGGGINAVALCMATDESC